MSYTIALSSFPDNSSSIFSEPVIDWVKKTYFIKRPAYTTVITKELIHNISYKSKIAIEKIDSFLNLNDNWDSYGAETLSKIAIENAKNFIKLANNDGLEVYFTAPGRNGDVLVEFQFSKRISAEIYFNSDGSNELLIFGDTECITEGSIESNYIELITYKDEFKS
jgi:hypothetical protein